MGTFAGYVGELNIPEERRPEFAERMLKLFTQGGMMMLDQVNIMDVNIELMSLPRMDKKQQIIAVYNYFEDDWWEGTGINAEKGEIWSNKIGWNQFNWVTQAAYVLAEFYSDTPMFTTVDGDVINAAECIGWLNHLFNEEYTNIRCKDLWEIYKILPEEVRHQDLLRIGREADMKSISGVGYLTYFEIVRSEEYKAIIDTKSSPTDDEGNFNPIQCAAKTRECIRKIKENFEDRDAALARINRLITAKTEVDIKGIKGDDFVLVICAQCLSYDLVLFYIAEAFDLDFWQLLKEKDPTASWESIYDQDQLPFPAVPPVKTAEFLNCTDDDRVFWWTQDGDVTFSEDMEQWMADLSEEMVEILATEGDIIAPDDFFMTFLKTLNEANHSYRRVYAFSTMFQEFVRNAARREYQAAVVLLQRLLKRYEEEIPVLKEARWPSEFNLPGRKKIKKYLAILANPELRQLMFKF